MTVNELINLLKEYPENMPVGVSVPENILDDGYIESYRLCIVDGLYLRSDRPMIEINYDRNKYIEIE